MPEKRIVDVRTLNTLSDAELSRTLFDGTCKFINGTLSEWASQNADRYRKAKQDARLEPNSREIGQQLREQWARPRQFSEQELLARGRFSEQTIREIRLNNQKFDYGNGHETIGELAARDPKTYDMLLLASASYNIGGLTVEQAEARLAEAQRPKPAKTEEQFTLSGVLAAALNLPDGTRVDRQTYLNAVEAKAKLDAAKASNKS